MSGPDDLPSPDEPFTADAFQRRWPTGAEKAELFDGVLVFTGSFDERDVQLAQRTYPDRQVILYKGNIEVHPAGSSPPRSILETYIERLIHRKAGSPA
jgi:hypothetical protein